MHDPAGGGASHRFYVLGETRLERPDGTEVELRPLAARVLTALAFRRDERTALEPLIELVWPDDPPPTVRKSLQNTVAMIRQTAGSGVIETAGEGYRLGRRVAVDRAELRRLARSTAPLDDIALAEALLRGQPWQLIDGDVAVLADVGAIDAERLALGARVVEQLAETDLDAAIRVANELVERAPWDERLCHLLATNLYRAGRRADSLREIDRARSTLVEAGLDLGPALRDLQQQILRDDVVGDAAPKRRRSTSTTTPTADVFVGRHDELSRLGKLLGAATAGSFAACVISGVPGIGKSTLARRFTEQHRDVSCVVATCSEFAAAPLQPLTDALSDIVASQTTIGAEQLRRALGEQAPLVLVVDDVQWADDATASLLCDLVARQRPAGMLLLVIARPAVGPHRSVARLHELIAREGTVLTLSSLARRDLAELLGHHTDRASVDDVDWFAAATGGSPLIASLLLRTDVGRLGRDAGPVPGVTAEIDALVDAQLELAGPDVAALLQWIAVCDRPPALVELAAVAGESHVALLDAADRACALGLAVETAPDRVEVAHTTLRAGLLHGLSASRIGAMHARLRDELWQRDGRWAEVAFHAVRATGSAAYTKAAEATLCAVDEALRMLSPRDALTQVAAIVAQFPAEVADPATHVDLLIRATRAATVANEVDRRDVYVAEATSLARRHGMVERFARAVIARGMYWEQGGFDDELDRLTAEALDLLADSGNVALRVQLLAVRACLYAVAGGSTDRGNDAVAVELAAAAMSAASATDDRAAHIAARQARILTLWSETGYVEQTELATELLTIADHPWVTAQGVRWRAIPRLCLGDRHGFRADRDALTAVAADFHSGGSVFRAYALQWRAMDALLDGDWVTAREEIDATLDEFGESNVALGAWAQLAWIALETGTAASLLDDVERLADDQPGMTATSVFAALAAALVGETDRADRRLRAALGDGFGAVPRDITWTSMVAGIAEMCALTENVSLAAHLADVLVPWHGTIVCTAGGLWSMGAAERSTALFRGTVGELDRAAELFGRAVEVERALAAVAVERRTAAWQARFGLADDGTVDHLNESIAVSGHHGLTAIVG